MIKGSSQTPPLKIFGMSEVSPLFVSVFTKEMDEREGYRARKKVFIVEDVIIHELLTKNIVIRKKIRDLSCFKNPLNKKDIIRKQEASAFSSSFTVFKNTFSQDRIEQYYFQEYIQTFNDCLTNFNHLFDKFNKIRDGIELSLLEGFCCFVIWISSFIKGCLLSDIFDLILLLYMKIQDKCLSKNEKNYFLKLYIEEEQYNELIDIEETLIQLGLNSKEWGIDSCELISYLSMYLNEYLSVN